MSADASEVTALAMDLNLSGSLAESRARPVVTRGALNIKNDLIAQARSSRHFKGFAPGITYEVKGLEAEIGPERGVPGSLANIAYFGTSKGGGTVEDPGAALEREMGPFYEQLLKAVGKL